jgi:mannose-6-phosphate isomerase-like protein (cupin superfamily)
MEITLARSTTPGEIHGMKKSDLDSDPLRRISRRKAIAVASASVAAAALVTVPADAAPNKPKPARTADGRWTRLRRVVTSEDAAGKGVLLQDGEPTNSVELNGTRITRLWETAATPVPLPLTADAGATAGNAYRKGFVGTSFYVAELPGGSHAPAIPMHKNATVDYMAILSGRIVLRIENRDIELGPGDTIVQGGNLHTWINRWQEPCLLLFVVLTGLSS